MTTAARPVLLGTALATTLVLTACGGGTATDDATAGAGNDAVAPEVSEPAAGDAEASLPLSVVAGFYPLEFLASRVGGDRVEVTGLTPPGAEAHDLELSPQALVGLTSSDLIVALSEFQPAVDEAVTGVEVPVVDLAVVADRPYVEAEAGDADDEGEERGATDPHFWLDPIAMVEAAETIAGALTEVDPDGDDVYTANAEALTAELTELDEEAQAAFASCEIETLVTAHDAFGYFADRYGFEIRSINGLSPDQAPDAGTLAEISDFVAESDVGTVYTETLVSSDIADTVAAEAGVETAVLDPVEGITDSSAGSDYLEVMRANIDMVRTGQACA